MNVVGSQRAVRIRERGTFEGELLFCGYAGNKSESGDLLIENSLAMEGCLDRGWKILTLLSRVKLVSPYESAQV